MADSCLMAEILDRLSDAELTGTDVRACSESELIEVLGLNSAWSNTQVKRALGRLIRDGKVSRHRCWQQYIGHDERPIILRLKHAN